MKFPEFDTIRGATIKLVGKRGLAAIETLPENAKNKTLLDQIAKRSRRKGVTVQTAVDAARTYHEAYTRTWPASRDAARHEIARAMAERFAAQGGRGWSIDRRNDRHLTMLRPQRATRDAYQLARTLEYRREHDVIVFFRNASPNLTCGVEWITSADSAGVAVDCDLDWNGYSKRTKCPKTNWSVMVRAVNHKTHDLPGGNRIIDGLLTLAADPVPSPDGLIRAWSAVWARKAKGISWEVKRGVIVQDPGGACVHGKDVKTAVATLKRRSTIVQDRALSRMSISRDEAIIVHGDVALNWQIARRAGLCAEGIQAWAEANFPNLDPRTASITVRQAIETRSSEYLVMLAVAVAVGRQRTRLRETA